MKILAFGTSNSSESINRQLAAHAAGLVEGADVETLDIAEFEMPIFCEARERELGQPDQARAFYRKIGEADALVISYAEHNGSYTAAWKNLFDWTSRIDRKVFQDKPVLYLSTSPGPGGAASVLAAAVGSAPFFGANLAGHLSVPSFYDNFDTRAGEVTHPDIRAQLLAAVGDLVDTHARAGADPALATTG